MVREVYICNFMENLLEFQRVNLPIYHFQYNPQQEYRHHDIFIILGSPGVLSPAKVKAHQNKGLGPGPNWIFLVHEGGCGWRTSGCEKGGARECRELGR